jgi:fructoselysine-6-P-deglycase FrlB-like protein
LDQPQALQATLKYLSCNADLFDHIGQIQQQEHVQVVLTGMGSSLQALCPLELMLIAAGEKVTRVETSELIYSMPSLLASSNIIVAVSQSGKGHWRYEYCGQPTCRAGGLPDADSMR